MYKEIITSDNNEFTITQAGAHVFYCHNITTELKITLAKEGVEVFFYGLFTLDQSDHAALHITLHHTAPYTKSLSLIKSVLDHSTYFHFTGMIQIEDSAHDAQAHVTNNNLLLSPDTRVITQPQLKVAPHQVTCSHAANTLPIDTHQITYLMNRGMSETKARTLIINGFCDEIIRHKQ